MSILIYIDFAVVTYRSSPIGSVWQCLIRTNYAEIAKLNVRPLGHCSCLAPDAERSG